MWKLIVWTRLGVASPDRLVEIVTDPHEVAGLMPRWCRWDVSDPVGLMTARRSGTARAFSSRIRTPAGGVDWPIEVMEGSTPTRFTERAENRWFRTWVHRHRVERAVGGRVRYVEELVLEPVHAPARLAVRGVSSVLMSTHRRLVSRLIEEGVASEGAKPSCRVYRLEAANRAHAEAALGEIPGV